MLTCTFENGGTGSLRHVVADVLVLKGDTILLAKRAKHLTEGGKWGLIGGYLDRDETIAEGARREIMEETGYTVDNLTLLTIHDSPQRTGEDRQNISFVFFCEALEEVGEKDDESDELRWFPLDKLPPAHEISFDHIDGIMLYKEYRDKPFPLPRYTA